MAILIDYEKNGNTYIIIRKLGKRRELIKGYVNIKMIIRKKIIHIFFFVSFLYEAYKKLSTFLVILLIHVLGLRRGKLW